MIQPIYLYGSEVLRQKAEAIDPGDREYVSRTPSRIPRAWVSRPLR